MFDEKTGCNAQHKKHNNDGEHDVAIKKEEKLSFFHLIQQKIFRSLFSLRFMMMMEKGGTRKA
jgi:hypothetical protein